MFGGHRLCGSVDMFLVSHVITQHHVIKGSHDFMGGIPSWKVPILPSLVTISIAVEQIQCS